MQPINIHYRDYLITTDKSKMQTEAIHHWLATESYWCKNIPYDLVKKAFDNSFCVGVLKDGEQVGYARLITDYTTFAYLADVYVEEEHRGNSLSKQMMQVLMDLDWTKQLRRMMLATLDAHKLYEQFGFKSVALPERLMEVNRPVIYGDNNNPCK
ncbi:MAG: GNAT family N-acetyltransferase [Bacteroidetes bacterium]|nr:GNAT family N-acetyltransferase [Bacteroidota bacterium]